MGGDTMKQLYDSYKPSGIDWIGDVPEHWNKCRFKYIGSSRNGLTYSPSDVKDSGKLVIRSSNIQDSKLNYDDCVFVTKFPETLTVKQGDTIICSRNGSIKLIGKSVFIETDMDVTFGAFMMRFRPYEHPKYSHYLLSFAITRYKGLFATTTINQLTADALGKMEAVMPPYSEQTQIADYLDKKCDEIDAAIAKVDRELELIDELKQSEISRVVTRGLDPTAPLRPSGIDWIGDIPSNWMVKPLKYHSDIIMGQSPSGNDITEEGTILFMQGNAEFGQIYPNPTTYCNMCVKHSRINDILMSVRAPVGELNISDKIYGIGRGLCSIRPINLNRQFLWYYLLKSKTDFDYFSNGSTFSAITMQTLLDFPIVIPPLSEQKEIADYLDRKCAEIDGLKVKLVKKRETLKELRQAIISEVVTGKRKVI